MNDLSFLNSIINKDLGAGMSQGERLTDLSPPSFDKNRENMGLVCPAVAGLSPCSNIFK